MRSRGPRRAAVSIATGGPPGRETFCGTDAASPARHASRFAPRSRARAKARAPLAFGPAVASRRGSARPLRLAGHARSLKAEPCTTRQLDPPPRAQQRRVALRRPSSPGGRHTWRGEAAARIVRDTYGPGHGCLLLIGMAVYRGPAPRTDPSGRAASRFRDTHSPCSARQAPARVQTVELAQSESATAAQRTADGAG